MSCIYKVTNDLGKTIAIYIHDDGDMLTCITFCIEIWVCLFTYDDEKMEAIYMYDDGKMSICMTFLAKM